MGRAYTTDYFWLTCRGKLITFATDCTSSLSIMTHKGISFTSTASPRLLAGLFLAFCCLVWMVSPSVGSLGGLVPNHDLEGVFCPQGSGIDRGAHESAHPGPIIIDHTCTDITRIPDYWLEQAKELTIHYAHTSHGSQISSGILNLELQDTKYSIAIRTSSSAGLPPVEDPPALRMYDGNPPETYISPDDYWDGDGGKDRTRAVADTGDYDFSMWSWCGQVSSATEGYIQNYLDTLNQFENEYPDMRFIYMTGHLDGTGSTGNLHVRNEQIRNYCIENNKVLFDFADIERYDPNGTDYLDLGANDNCDYDGGNWADEWCAPNPDSDLCASCSCAHSKPLNCNLKGRAFWWMMARLAGWSGSAFSVSLTPDVTVIPRGGNWGFQATVTNNTDEVQTVGFATNVTLPNGIVYPPLGYLFGPVAIVLNPYESKSGHLSHTIPINAPLGTYTYHGYVGNLGVGVVDEDRFDFEVIEGSTTEGAEEWETTVDKGFTE